MDEIFDLCPKEKKCYERFFRHFSLRLSERYGLLISFEEYVLLSKMPYIINAENVINPSGCVVKRGWLFFNNERVKVIRATFKYTPLLTALPKKKIKTKESI